MPVKESYFFSVDSYWGRGKAWYEVFFRDCPIGSKPGEFCPGYLCNELTPQRIASFYPHIKIIVCLRSPIDRAFSHYLHDIRYGFISASIPFRLALETYAHYLTDGLYGAALTRYYQHFPKGNILVVLHEHSKKDPRAFISSIYSFLGVDVAYVPDSLNRMMHDYRMPRSVLIESFFSRLWLITIKFMARGHLHRVTRLIRRSFIIPLFLALNTKLSPRPTMRDDDRRFLMEYFSNDIHILERLIGISLSSWR